VSRSPVSRRGAGFRFRGLARGFAALAAGGLILLAGCSANPAQALPAPPPAEVVVSKPITRSVTETIDATGVLAPLEDVEIRPRVTGFLEKMYFSPRAIVKKDQLLFTIDPRPFEMALSQAEAELAALRAQMLKAENDVKKVEELFARGAASADERIDVVSKRDALAANIAAAYARKSQAELNLDWTSVKSPIEGRISRNLIDIGNLVSADTTVLARVVNDADVYAYYDISERDSLALRQRARLTGDKLPVDRKATAFLGLMTDTGFPYEGVVDYADPSLRPSTGTIQVRSRFPNPDGVLIGGLFARVRVPVSKPFDALMVTERALGSDQGQRYVLLVNAKDVVEYRPVKVGKLENGLRVIEQGLSGDDRVITNGLQRVRPGVTVKPVEAPMPVAPEVQVAKPQNSASKPAESGETSKAATSGEKTETPKHEKQ